MGKSKKGTKEKNLLFFYPCSWSTIYKSLH